MYCAPCSAVRSGLQSGPICCALPAFYILPSVLCPQSLVISCTVSAVSGHLLYCVRSLWSSPLLCPQFLVIPCSMSAISGHLLYCPQSLVISCTMFAVSGHFLYYVCS
ncbi:unnamed protein product, partial [Staurois parvus]